MPAVSVLTPAYRAQDTITRTVKSVLAQSFPGWELLIIADDGQDYAQILQNNSIADNRIRFLSTGGIRTGVAHARNIGLRMSAAPIIALLDADDRFHPEKLERMTPLAARHGLCSCILEHVAYEPQGRKSISTIGASAADRLLAPGQYMEVNYSANAMIVFDKNRIPIGWREDLKVMEDLVFPLAAFDYIPNAYHIAEALHEYIYTPGSLTNASNTAENFITTKEKLLAELSSGTIGFYHPAALESFRHFLLISIVLEKDYAELLAQGRNVNFSEMLASRLKAASGKTSG